MPTEFIVMTAHAKVAVLEVKRGLKPKSISARAKGVVRIVALRDKLSTAKRRARQDGQSEFLEALEDAERLARGLNFEARMTKSARQPISEPERIEPYDLS